MLTDYQIPEDLDLHPDHTPIPDPVSAPAELLSSRAFLDWFGTSTVVTETGAPLMIFHGTAREDREFRSSRHYDLEGAYFTPCYREAKSHAHMDSSIDCEQPYVISAFVRLINPFRMNNYDSQVLSTQQVIDLKARGFDGVIGVDEETGMVGEYVAFDPSQIAQFHQGRIEIPEPPRPTRKRHRHSEDLSPSP